MTSGVNYDERMARLEAFMARRAGKPVCITIRGEGAFTFSTEERHDGLMDVVKGVFGDGWSYSVAHDDECGSFVYVECATPVVPS